MQSPHERPLKRKQPEPATSSLRDDESANLNPTATKKNSPPSLNYLRNDEWVDIRAMLLWYRGGVVFKNDDKQGSKTRNLINAALNHFHHLQSDPNLTMSATARKFNIKRCVFYSRYHSWEGAMLWKQIFEVLIAGAQNRKDGRAIAFYQNVAEQHRKLQTKNKQRTQPPPPLPLVQQQLEQSLPGTQDKQFYRDLDVFSPLLSVQPRDDVAENEESEASEDSDIAQYLNDDPWQHTPTSQQNPLYACSSSFFLSPPPSVQLHNGVAQNEAACAQHTEQFRGAYTYPSSALFTLPPSVLPPPPPLPPLPLVQHPLEQSLPGTQDKQFYLDLDFFPPLLSVQPRDDVAENEESKASEDSDIAKYLNDDSWQPTPTSQKTPLYTCSSSSFFTRPQTASPAPVPPLEDFFHGDLLGQDDVAQNQNEQDGSEFLNDAGWGL